VFAYELEGDGVGGPGSGCLQLGGASAPQRREVIVKIKAPDEDAIAVGEALAHVCDARVGDAFTRWRDRLGLIGAQARELAIYRQKDPRVRRHVPALRGALVEAGTCTLVLDRISDAVLLDSVDRPEAWTREHIDAAIDGLARLHAVWYGKEDALTQQPWIGHVATASNVAEMSDLWAALAAHAAPSFSSWTGPGIVSIHSRLARDIGTWWRAFDGLPRTLIHHDFNPRNVCLRRSSSGLELSAYDWELSTVGSPARDLAELLCFVLPDHATDERVHGWIDRHRLRLERETGSPIDAAAWRATFASALYDLLVRRWPVYALVHRVRRQAFLPRAVRAWRRLYESFPWRNQP
jgi:aminoglycoside phosphotransferase (APT) family kinase protein